MWQFPHVYLSTSLKNHKNQLKTRTIPKANWKLEQSKSQLKTWKIQKSNWKPEKTEKPTENTKNPISQLKSLNKFQTPTVCSKDQMQLIIRKNQNKHKIWKPKSALPLSLKISPTPLNIASQSKFIESWMNHEWTINEPLMNHKWTINEP